MIKRQPISRRTFLRGTGVALSLPMLDAMLPVRLLGSSNPSPQRLLAINIAFGLHAPFLFPQTTGGDYESTPYLDVIGDFRDDFTIFSSCASVDRRTILTRLIRRRFSPLTKSNTELLG